MKKILKFLIVVCIIAIIISCAVYVLPCISNEIFSFDFHRKQTSSLNSSGELVVSTEGNGALSIYFLNVGQGDCSIIVFPDDKTMIIDSGNNYKSNEIKIKEFTDKLNIKTFDYLLLTHADADHVGCFDYVFANYEVKYVFRPNVLSTYADAKNLYSGINRGFTDADGGTVSSSKAYYDFLYGLQTEPDCGSEIFNSESDFSGAYSDGENIFSYYFDFLTPTASPENIKYKNANDYSPICSLTYNGVTVLFTGDVESNAEKEFMSYYSTFPDCDVIKVAHHGAETSSSEAFLKKVKPEYAVIQCGVTKTYKHPRQLILDRLYNMGAVVYRTDKNGDISFRVECGEDYRIGQNCFVCANPDLSENRIGGDTAFNLQNN